MADEQSKRCGAEVAALGATALDAALMTGKL
jgi:hypothetical protein